MPDLVPRGPDAPSYGPTPQVAPSQLPNARMNPDMPLAAAGGGQEVARTFGASQDLADAGIKLQEMEQERNYQIQETMGVAQATTLANTLHAKGVAAKGENAFGVRDSINEEFRKGIENIGKDMPPAVQVRFQRHVNRIAGHLDGTLAMHEMGETQRVDNESSDQLINANMDKARLNAQRWDEPDTEGSPNPVDASARDIVGATHQWASRNGVPQKVADAHASKMVARMYGGVITSMLDNQQELTASQAFKKYSESGLLNGDPALKDKLAEQVDAGSIRGESARDVEQAFDAAKRSQSALTGGGDPMPDSAPTFKTEKDALDAVRAITAGKDQKVIDAADQRAIKRFYEEKKASVEATDAAYEDASKVVEKTGSIDNLDQKTYWALPEADRKRLRGLQQELARPPRMIDDPDAYNHWNFKSDEDKLGMSEADFLREVMHNPGLSAQTKEKFSDQMKALRSRDDRQSFKWTHEDFKNVFEAAQKAELFGLTMNDRPTPGGVKGDDDKKRNLMNFMKVAESAFYTESGGKPMKPEDKDKVIDQLIKDQDIRKSMTPSWWQYVLPPQMAPESSKYIPAYSPWWGTMENAQIPDDERKILQKKFPNSSENKLQMLYAARQKGMSPYGIRLFAEDLK